jgi:hypothetical protein
VLQLAAQTLEGGLGQPHGVGHCFLQGRSGARV